MRDPTARVGAETSQPFVGSAQTFVTLGIVLLFGLVPVLPRGMVIAVAGAIALLTAVGWFRRWVVVTPLGAYVISLDMQAVGVDLGSAPIDEILSFRAENHEAYRKYARNLRRCIHDLGLMQPQEQHEEITDLASDIRKKVGASIAGGAALLSLATGDRVDTGHIHIFSARRTDFGRHNPHLRMGRNTRWWLADVAEWIARGCPVAK
jgi:hypothetical protein